MKIWLTIPVFFLTFLVFAPKAEATTYYVNFDCATTTTCGNGLATTTAFSGLEEFMEAARSAGDIAFVRRGVGSTTSATLDATSDGNTGNPIIVSADYDNLWSDFATTTQTYTVAAGSTTFTANASISDLSAGQWIYVAGDCFETYNSTTMNTCAEAYEVKSVSGTTLTLYFPYAGSQTGAGLSLRIMPSAPYWNQTQSSSCFLLAGDDNWYMKGIRFGCTPGVSGNVIQGGSGGSKNWTFEHTIVSQAGTARNAVGKTTANTGVEWLFKYLRVNPVAGAGFGVFAFTSVGPSVVNIENGYVYCGGAGPIFSGGGSIAGGGYFKGNWKNVYFDSCAATDVSSILTDMYEINCVNCVSTTTLNIFQKGNAATTPLPVSLSNFSYQYLSSLTNGVATSTIQSTTTASFLRPGGGPTVLKVLPSNILNPISKEYTLKLFEYPIYADTSSKQYNVYFTSTSTAAWTANPTARELWIECDYWSHAGGATPARFVKASTGTLNFSGSTAWANLSVSCQPAQSGILYLRGYYAKPKESGKMNEFYLDQTPVII